MILSPFAPCRCSFRANDIVEHIDDLRRGCRPGHSRGIHFFERMDEVLTVKRDVRLSHGGTVPGVKGGIPLFVLVSKSYNSNIAFFDESFGTYPVDLR